MDDSSAQLLACIPRLRRYARALVGNQAAADDLVQDTIERGWSKLASWRQGADMRAWLFSIMHNLFIDQARKQSIPTESLNEHTQEPLIHTMHMERLEILDMEAALNKLPAEQKEVLLLVTLEELSYEEVAATLRIPLGTVMSRLSRARERLRASMEGRVMTSPLKVVK